MTTAAELAARLKKVRRSGDEWSAQCPAHDDQVASLSFRDGPDGKLLAHCHAGCPFRDILTAAGFKLNGNAEGSWHILNEYEYYDQDGVLVYQVVRIWPKDFRQRRPDDKGGWIWKMKGVERIPYRLPEVIQAEEVFIVEGEKDADNLRKLGITATCNPGGAGKWWPSFNKWFAGKRVVIIPDNDDAGRAHAATVASHMKAVASSVKLIELFGLPEKGDVSDWLAAGGTAEELLNAASEAEQSDEKPLLDLVWADDITIDVDERGLVDGLLSSTAMSVIYGESGSGKTFNAIDIACHIAAGMLWRGMSVDQGIVVYIAAESPKSIKRRVWAWKQHYNVAHLPLVVVQSHVNLLDPEATLPLLIQEIERIAARQGKVVLIVIDTLSRAMAGADENSARDMTGFIGNCDKLRIATDAHVMIVHHCGKDLARGARGHSSLRAATDTEIEVAGNAAKVTKQRDMESLGAYGFSLEEVELGKSVSGRVITTCVAVPADVVVDGGQIKKKTLGYVQQIVFDTLAHALREQGKPWAGPEPKAGTIVVTHEELRCLVARKLPQQELKKKNEAFDRAVASLVRDNMIRHLDGLLWIGLG